MLPYQIRDTATPGAVSSVASFETIFSPRSTAVAMMIRSNVSLCGQSKLPGLSALLGHGFTVGGS